MPEQTIICGHCGSTRVSKDPTMTRAVVQQVSNETRDPIGPPTTFYIFKCLSCGEGIYLEKYEAQSES